MKAFACDACGSLVFFENVQCLRCGHGLGFLPDISDVSALEPADNGFSLALAPAARGRLYRPCGNGQQHGICNWLVPLEETNVFCVSCRLNQVVPNLSVPDNLQRWHKLELAKRRIVYTLSSLRLPTEGVPEENRRPLRFGFLGDSPAGPPVVTGHRDGLITINIAEADDDERERRRIHLHEPYRTLLGHLRHEVAHFYWDRLIANSSWLPRFRELFGDETGDYDGALQRYYQQGPPADWQTRLVSAYASAHPWEDWAETWAHYLHIRDTLETAAAFGVTLRPQHPSAKAMTAGPKGLFENDFGQLLESWAPVAYTLNTLNRSMGLPDLYPFVLTAPAIEKLRFVHEVIQGRNNRPEQDRKAQVNSGSRPCEIPLAVESGVLGNGTPTPHQGLSR